VAALTLKPPSCIYLHRNKMQISKTQIKRILAYGVGLFLSLQFLLSYSYKLSPFNQIFLLTSLHSKILHKSTISETSDVNSVTISRDGQTIVSHSQNNEIKVRNLKTGNLINTIGIPKSIEPSSLVQMGRRLQVWVKMASRCGI
jgi:WD40 repeat protein